MKVFVVIHYSDGCQAFFKTRESAENYIKTVMKDVYHDDAFYDCYIGEGELSD